MAANINMLYKMLLVFIISSVFLYAGASKAAETHNISALTSSDSSLIDALDQRLSQSSKIKILKNNRDFGLQFYYNNDISSRTGIIAGKEAGGKSIRAQKDIIQDFKSTSYGGPRRNTELYGFKMSIPLDK